MLDFPVPGLYYMADMHIVLMLYIHVNHHQSKWPTAKTAARQRSPENLNMAFESVNQSHFILLLPVVWYKMCNCKTPNVQNA